MLAHRVWASILHWLGNFHIESYPINHLKLPNQCKMLAHTLCASILHWLGSFEHWLGSFEIAPKNFEIFWHWLGSFEILPNQCKMLAYISYLTSSAAIMGSLRRNDFMQFGSKACAHDCLAREISLQWLWEKIFYKHFFNF